MKWVNSTDLRHWADRISSQNVLPQLVRKLIRATSNDIKFIKFPSGENVLIGGWDGILETTTETEYIPIGISLWEFGVNKVIKEKADKDYAKRTDSPLGFDPKKSTFVFVTPRFWQNKDEWVKGKMAEGKWLNIKVIDSETLEEWLETAPTVSSWLASTHLEKFPGKEIQSTEEFWEEWSIGSIKLLPKIVLGGRDKECFQLLERIETPSIIPVQAVSAGEALAFIIAAFKNNEEIEEDFFARSIIVNDLNTFRQLVVNSKPLIIIPRFEDEGVINRAVSKGHTILVPLGADSSDNWTEKIKLSGLERESFVNSLEESGISKEQAEKYSKETARNLTILRRQLEFNRDLPAWAKAENIQDLVPALLVGRWDESKEQDKNIVASFAGVSYESYIMKLKKWQLSTDPPIIKIGTFWRLSSPLDSWTNAAKYLTAHNFETLKNIFLTVLSEIDPAFELEADQRYMASFYGKTRIYSDKLREGLIQSLILISVFGENIKDLPTDSGFWVDSIVSELLNKEDLQFWRSIEDKLPLIAEASPDSFLNAFETLLKKDNLVQTIFFEQEKGFLDTRSYHTGLLWALENIAWMPKYLSRASLILAQLATIDPGGNLSNRPINSLRVIFTPWFYQTLAPFQERIDVLKLIVEKESDIAWKLLVSMLPDPMGGHVMPTHKMRWRLFYESFRPNISYGEIWDTHSAVVELLLTFDVDEKKLVTLIDESQSISLKQADREKLLSFIEKHDDTVLSKDNIVWHKLREILFRHRTFRDATWGLPESELSRYENLFQRLTPTDKIERIKWMFDEHYPHFPEGEEKKEDYRIRQDLINRRRIEALTSIYQEYGIEKIKEIIPAVKESWILGDTAGYIIDDESEIISLCDFLKESDKKLHAAKSFVYRKSILNGVEWIFDLYNKLKTAGSENIMLIHFLIPLNQDKVLWNFIENENSDIVNGYWKEMTPHFYNISDVEKLYGINKLIEFKRFYSAIYMSAHLTNSLSPEISILPSDTMTMLLFQAALEEANEQETNISYEIVQLFEEIDKREDIELILLTKLEWLYLPLLASYGTWRSPKILHNELSNNPDFFVEVISWIYKSENDKLVEEQRKALTDEQLQNRAKSALELLHSWKKVPGVDDAGLIDSDIINNWVNAVRSKAIEKGLLGITDSRIGQVLAEYPESTQTWPPDEICKIIEAINTANLNDNFVIAISNRHGSYTKSPFEGGDRERKLADNYAEFAKKHKNKYPVVSSMLDKVSRSFLSDAKREDEQAEATDKDY